MRREGRADAGIGSVLRCVRRIPVSPTFDSSNNEPDDFPSVKQNICGDVYVQCPGSSLLEESVDPFPNCQTKWSNQIVVNSKPKPSNRNGTASFRLEKTHRGYGGFWFLFGWFFSRGFDKIRAVSTRISEKPVIIKVAS